MSDSIWFKKSVFFDDGARHVPFPLVGYTRLAFPFDLAYDFRLYRRDAGSSPLVPLFGGRHVHSDFIAVRLARHDGGIRYLDAHELSMCTRTHAYMMSELYIGNTAFISSEMIDQYAKITGIDASSLLEAVRNYGFKAMPKADLPPGPSRINAHWHYRLH